MAGKRVAFRLGLRHLALPKLVDLLEAHGDEHLVRFRRVALLDIGEADHRQSMPALRGAVLLVHGEGNDVPIRLLREIVVNHFGDLTDSEDDDITH